MTRRFIRDEQGAMTAWMLIWAVVFLGLAGVAVDVSNAFRNKAMLQITADTAAHAAIGNLISLEDEQLAVKAAVETAARNLSFDDAPDPVTDADVIFGLWDHSKRAFEPGDPSLASGMIAPAVQVTARRDEAAGNPVLTTFLRVMGVEFLDVAASSVAVTAFPPCAYNGIIAREWVTLTSNVDFGDKMCIHGELGLSTNNNLELGEDSTFSTPDTRHVSDGGNIDVPTSNYRYVLEHAEPGTMAPLDAEPENVRERIDELRDEIRTKSRYKEVTHGNGGNAWDIEQDYLDGYRYFELTCINSKDRFSFPNFKSITRLENVFIVTDCALKSSGSVYMKDIVLAVDRPHDTEAIFLTGKTEVTTSATDCADAGNFLAVTTGGMKFTADQSYANTRLIASRSLQYSAAPDVNWNISIQSWENVDMTAGGDFTSCPTDNPYVLGNEPFPLLVGG